MSWRIILFVWLMAAAAGCASANLTATRALTGIDQRQALIAAQHSLAQDGLDLEKIDFDQFALTTVWVRENRRMIQYEVTVTPRRSADSGGDAGVTGPSSDLTVTIAVSAKARNRVAGGWSDPVATRFSGAEKLLDKIVALSVGRYDPDVQPKSEPVASRGCAVSADCPAGSHCGSGRCVSECGSDGDCGAGLECDDRGRCLAPAELSGSKPEEMEAEPEGKKSGRRRGHE